MQENLHGYESWCFASKKGTHSISGAYLLWWIFMIVYPQFRQNLASIAWSVWREHARTNEPNIKSLLSCIDPRNIRNGPTRIAIQYDIFRAWYCWLSYLLDVEVVHSPFQSNEEHDAVICRHLVVNRHWTFMDFWDVSVWINYVSDVCTCKIYLCINMYIYIYECVQITLRPWAPRPMQPTMKWWNENRSSVITIFWGVRLGWSWRSWCSTSKI